MRASVMRVRTMRVRTMRVRVMTALAVGGTFIAAGRVEAQAGKKPSAAQTTVEIRGEVPTPQVVTVRPREEPEYSRGVLVPALYDRHFWVAILAPYRIVPPLPTGTAHRQPGAAVDATGAPVPAPAAAPATAPVAVPATPPAEKPATTPKAIPNATPNAPKES